jgi:hypothetical protein
MPTAYERHKQRALERQAEQSRQGRDIGDIPAVKNSARKGQALRSFRYFCSHYFPLRFFKAFSDDHLAVIASIEQAVLHGGLFALAMPRGSGKTTLCEVAAIWALLTGKHKFIYLVGASEAAATGLLDSIKAELSNNELLLADFPEVVYAIHALENQPRRAIGQLHHGQPTLIGWGADEIILPNIPGSRAAGAIVRVTGITGNIRGAKVQLPDGRSVRPSLVIIDDPQTDQSAKSPSQCQSRLATVTGAILNLAGPGERIAALMPCTVIQQGDLADQMLDRSAHPDWHGRRTKLVYQWPENEKLWAEYCRQRQDELKSGSDNSPEATAFYQANRKAMDAGAIIAWPDRYDPKAGEVSAIQHAYNLRLRIGDEAFFAELQNEPLRRDSEKAPILTAEEIAAKVNGFKRAELHRDHQILTAFIDVQGACLFWMVCAFAENFTGAIVDYGTWPEQPQQYFTLRNVRNTLQAKYPGLGPDAMYIKALDELTEWLLAREFKREDGAVFRIRRQLIDANWGDSTDAVYQFCRTSKYGAIVIPAHGRYYGASSVQFHETKKKKGEKVGHHWRIPPLDHGTRNVQHIAYDTNYWKTFSHARLSVPIGDPGSVSLFQPEKGRSHVMLADHLTSEYPEQVTAKGRTVAEWSLKSPGLDNHQLDGFVGCLVAASEQGAKLEGFGDVGPKRKKVILGKRQRTL